ncbi:SDR family oxidoreductase [Catalinimonas sp. 4WD22]|uniref:SDR family oxidoreductase n=1 Tax=Catalinimonas locisalis TaxID=3133978 RepID=UPI0031012A7F
MKKLAVVTGGTKGIGKAIIKSFATEGFSIATCSRTESDLEKLQKEINDKYPEVDFLYQSADLSDKNQVKAFAAMVNTSGIPVEILVNNSGLFIPGQIHQEEEGALEKMIDTNLYSAYHLSRALIKPMMERKKGHIFNICSTASIVPYTNGGSYCIAKFAMLGMSKVLREEMKPYDIRVTSVLPGATYTASWEGTDLPEERFMKSEDVAETVLTAYKLSDRAVMEEVLIRPQLGDL